MLFRIAIATIIFHTWVSANLLFAASINPCADDIEEFCGDLEGESLHNCLARKRNRISIECSEAVILYYRRHTNEELPDADDLETHDTQNQESIPFGVPDWGSRWPNPFGSPQNAKPNIRPNAPEIDPYASPWQNFQWPKSGE